MKKKIVQKALSFALTFCMMCTCLPHQAFAVDVKENGGQAITQSEGNTGLTVTLKSYDGSETLGSLTVASGAVITQDDCEEIVSKEATLRGAYTFVGWSTTMGDVTKNYTAPLSFAITTDTVLYAVYRPITSSEVNVSIATDLVDALESFDGASATLGLTIDDATSVVQRDSEFYDFLSEYIDNHISEVVAADDATSAISAYTAASAASLNAQRIAHAYEDAAWSTAKRSDLNFAQEFVYMYTSHYIDVAEPFSGTYVNHDSTMYQLYITDLDRRTYATYYKNGRAVDVYSSMITLTAALVDIPGLLQTGTSTIAQSASRIDRMNGAITAIWDGYGDTNAISTLANDVYDQVCTLSYTDKEDLFAQMDQLVADVKEDISVNYGELYLDAAMGIVLSTLAFATGGGAISILLPYVSFYNDFSKSLFDQAYFVVMRTYIHTRVAERMMYALGMSDGRN